MANFHVNALYEASFASLQALSSLLSFVSFLHFFFLTYFNVIFSCFHSVLQKPSPNACPIPKVKVKSSPMIEKLQVGPGRAHRAAPAN